MTTATAAVKRQNGTDPVPDTNVRVRTTVVTPEMAVKWLEKNSQNRHINQRAVEDYARDMKAGRWHVTGDPIRFDENGELLDGQHRLWACIEADVEFTTVVARGVPSESRIVIDTGRKRTLGNYLQMSGETNAVALAAGANLCWRFDRKNLRRPGAGQRLNPTHEEAIAWIEDNSGIRDSVQIGRNAYAELRLGATAIIASHYLNSRVDAEAATTFWNNTASGADLEDGSPALALRRWVTRMLAQREKPSTEVMFANYMKAMRVWREGGTLRALHYRNDEEIAVWK